MTKKLARLGLLIAGGQGDTEAKGLGVDRATQIKTSGKIPQFRYKAKQPKVDEENRTITYIASDETVDRMGDIIKVAGWDLKEYKTNPVVLFNHNSHGEAPPIGTAAGTKKGQKPGGDPALLSPVKFAPEGVYAQADVYYALAKEGILSTVSVGFMPIKVHVPQTDEEREELGLGRFGVLFLKQKLFELSLVNIPANPAAVALSLDEFVSKGLVSAEAVSEWGVEEPSMADIYEARAAEKARGFIDLSKNLNAVIDGLEDEELSEADRIHKALDELDLDEGDDEVEEPEDEPDEEELQEEVESEEDDDEDETTDPKSIDTAVERAIMLRNLEASTELTRAISALTRTVGDLATKVARMTQGAEPVPASPQSEDDDAKEKAILKEILETLECRDLAAIHQKLKNL